MNTKHTPMVVAAARVLCARCAEQCNDFEDNWKVYGDMYLEDAKAALDAAAADLLKTAKAVAFSNGFDAAYPDKLAALRAAIAKATGGDDLDDALDAAGGCFTI